MKEGVLRNFTKFPGKHLHQGPFFNKVADLSPATLLKKRLWRSCFPVNFAKFLRTAFLQNNSRGLLLKTTAVFISNAFSDHEMSFEIKHNIKHNFRLKLGES